jgi:putative transposase
MDVVQFLPNQLFRDFTDGEGQLSRLYRILMSRPDSEAVVVIRMPDPSETRGRGGRRFVGKQRYPEAWERNTVEMGMAAGRYVPQANDPFVDLRRDEDLTPAERAGRDARWEKIEELVKESGAEILDPTLRWDLVRAAAEKHHSTVAHLDQCLLRYWQGGMMKNALIPDYSARGRTKAPPSPGSPKRGRPRNQATPRTDKLTGETYVSGPGINADLRIRELLYQGGKLFHEKRGLSLYKAYLETLGEFFCIGYSVDREGNPSPLLPPPGERPSYDQFIDWYVKRRDRSERIKGHVGEKRWNLRHRSAIGSTADMGATSGLLYQFDRTGSPVNIRSTIIPTQVVGQPGIYFVTDHFSHVIAGYSISLEGENWMGCMMALEQAIGDKVAHCRKYGIEIEPEEWPTVGRPEQVLADRGGGMWSANADGMVRRLDIHVTNTASGRADLKGLVERSFGMVNNEVLNDLPGAYDPDRQRGDPDIRASAVLDIHALHKVVIHTILHYNRSHYMKDHCPDEGLLRDDIPPFPLAYWRWGILNRGGLLRHADPEFVRHQLMPTASANVTDGGLVFEGLSYHSERAQREGWFNRKVGRQVTTVEVAYDPRDLGVIFLRTDEGRSVEPCLLTEKCRLFAGKSLDEVRAHFKEKRARDRAGWERHVDDDIALRATIAGVVAEAAATVENAGGKVTTKDVRANRAAERDMLRDAEKWVESGPPAAVEPEPATDSGVRPSTLDLLERIRKQAQR